VDEAAFFRVVRAGFSQKRKTLRNSLSAGLQIAPADAAQALEQAGVEPSRRAETLALEEWARVAGTLRPQ
jgi:16S rRNA (adenine1518-N6/adenine1519-N6)-dimethyltransferase